MSKRRSRPLSKVKLRQREQRRQEIEKVIQRRMLLEKLEDRHLLAGAQLISIEPSDGELLDLNGLTELDVAPRDLTLRFDEGQQFDLTTLDGIRISRAGNDLLLGTPDDVLITAGFLGPNSFAQNEIVARFAETPPDDLYRVEVFAFDDLPNGIVGLRNINGELFMPEQLGADRTTVDFRLALGAEVIAVVPQPITRLGNNSLQQARNQIEVYFNEELDPDDAINPEFYQLIYTADTADNTDGVTVNGVEAPFLPTSVNYSYDPVSRISRATLTFSNELDQLPGLPPGTKTFRLRLGSNAESPRPPAIVDLSIDGVSDFNTAGQALIQFTANTSLAESYGTSMRVFVDEADLGATPVAVAVNDNQVFITLNTNGAGLATARTWWTR